MSDDETTAAAFGAGPETPAEGCSGGGPCSCRGSEPAPPIQWRTRGEMEGSDAFFESLADEFPRQAAPLFGGVDRRRFMQLMGASLGLAGAAGCTRQPLEQIVPYVKAPEEIVPGVPLFFATGAPVGDGYVVGVLAESHMGRPTKLEGNPEHPASLGATDAQIQASVLNLYDPDRSQTIVNQGRIRTWEAFVDALSIEASNQEATGGAGLRILSGAVTSPTLGAQINRVLTAFPNARWYQWEPAGDRNATLGARAAFGRDVSTRYDLAAADLVVTLEHDLLGSGPGAVRYAKDFSRKRRVWETAAAGGAVTAVATEQEPVGAHGGERQAENAPPAGHDGGDPATHGVAAPQHGGPVEQHVAVIGEMNRLYAIESTPTPTSTLADHRLALPPLDIAAFAVALAAELGIAGAARPAGWSHPEADALIPVLARDLQAHRGKSVVAAGPSTSPEVHALAHAINEALGNVGTTVFHTEPVHVRPADPLADLTTLAQELRDGKVEALIILDANPVYDAPKDLQFDKALLSPATRTRIHWGLHDDETAQYCHWHVPATHYLETWSDARSFDGTVTLQQPLIEPLYGGKSALEVLSVLERKPGVPVRQMVQEQWQAQLSTPAAWDKAVHDGFVADSAAPATAVAVGGGAVGQAVQAIGAALAQRPPGNATGLTLSFRPDPSVGDGRYANNAWLQELPKPFSKVVWDNPVLVSPRTAKAIGVDEGMKDGLQGRNASMLSIQVGDRNLALPVWVLPGQADGVLTVYLGHQRKRAGKVGNGVGFDTYGLRTSDTYWHAFGVTTRPYDERHTLASTQGHFLMEGRPLARHATVAEYRQDAGVMHHGVHSPDPAMTMYPPWPYEGYKWGMAINLSSCTGCNACVIACQSENNIPVVGKQQVINQREMHWLRIDQYYEGDWEAPTRVLNQPVPCMQCENAPCEVVCPVAATNHSTEGLNDMVYNRCVGTRYCSNNCPYKVRRFNFYKFQDFVTESLKLQRNPDVTVRFRGVMEKCTYCVQRINHARIDAEREDRRIRDGEATPACAQACPTEAIVFGDLNDHGARVNTWKQQPLNYGLLEDINTRPRTTYLGRLNNPNPELAGPATAGGHGKSEEAGR